MKITATRTLVVATAMMGSVCAKEELIRRRAIDAMQWEANADAEEGRVEGFFRSIDWGDERGGNGGYGSKPSYSKGGKSYGTKGPKSSKSKDTKGPKSTKSPKGYPSPQPPGPPSSKPKDCPEIDYGETCDVDFPGDTCDAHTSCKPTCVPKYCKIPDHDPDKIHGYGNDAASDDHYVKLGSICGYFEYVEGEPKPRHAVEVCCEVIDTEDSNPNFMMDNAHPYDAQCAVCFNCDAPQFVNDACCKIANAPDAGVDGRNGNYDPQCDDDEECCKCAPGDSEDSYRCVKKGHPCVSCEVTTTTEEPISTTAEATTTTAEPIATTAEATTTTTAFVCNDSTLGQSCPGTDSQVCCDVGSVPACTKCEKCDNPQIVDGSCCDAVVVTRGIVDNASPPCEGSEICCKCGPGNSFSDYDCVATAIDCQLCLPTTTTTTTATTTTTSCVNPDSCNAATPCCEGFGCVQGVCETRCGTGGEQGSGFGACTRNGCGSNECPDLCLAVCPGCNLVSATYNGCNTNAAGGNSGQNNQACENPTQCCGCNCDDACTNYPSLPEVPGLPETGPVVCTDPLSFTDIEGTCIKEDEEAGGDGLCCKRDGIFTCTWCDECDYPQLVSDECCMNPNFRQGNGGCGDNPDKPFCCKCAAAVSDSSYKCVADLAECENCLPDCISGIDSRSDGLCAPFCQNACLALINEQCGCDIRPAVIDKGTWETVQLTCGQVPGSAKGFGGCGSDDFCCILFPDDLANGACDQVYANTEVQQLGLCGGR